MVLTVAGGLCFGLLGGFVIKTASGFAISLELDLLIGGVGGTLAGLAFGAMHVLDSGTHDAGGPLAVLHSDARYGTAYGLSIGSVAGAGTTIAVGPVYGLVVGLMSAVVFGVVLGSIAYARYLLAISLMRMRHGLPLRFGSFLEWAVGVGLMRKVGTSYQYRHREFHEWVENSPETR